MSESLSFGIILRFLKSFLLRDVCLNEYICHSNLNIKLTNGWNCQIFVRVLTMCCKGVTINWLISNASWTKVGKGNTNIEKRIRKTIQQGRPLYFVSTFLQIDIKHPYQHYSWPLSIQPPFCKVSPNRLAGVDVSHCWRYFTLAAIKNKLGYRWKRATFLNYPSHP